MTDRLDIDALEALEKAATPGPWIKKDSASGLSVYLMNGGRFLAESSWHGNSAAFPTRTGTNANFDLLAALRNAAPALIAAYRESAPLRSRVEALEGALTLLVADVANYPAWQRPCHALDVALAALEAKP